MTVFFAGFVSAHYKNDEDHHVCVDSKGEWEVGEKYEKVPDRPKVLGTS